MNNKKNQKYIEVDGVIYDIASGRVVNNKKKQIAHSNKNSVLDLRTPHNIVATNQQAIQAREVQSSTTTQHVQPKAQAYPTHRKATNIKPANRIRRPSVQKPRVTTNTFQSGNIDNFEYLSFVLARGLFSKGNLKLWQLSLVRTIFSPQTWLLLTLPLLLLQIRVIRHFTLNETLQKAKQFVAPDHYDTVTLAIGFTLIAFFVGVIIRSCITATGISVRLREIDNRPIKVLNALRSAIHSIIRQALNYIVHFIIIIFITISLIFISKQLFISTNPWITSNKYQIIVALFILWVMALIFLYTKHWLQVGLLARSSKTSHIQLKSIVLLFTAPSANMVSGVIGISLIILCYGVILSMSWFATNYFIHQTVSPTIIILILIAITTILLLTFLQYIQQSLWARQYYYASTKSSKSNELLYMEPSKPDSIWPIFVVVGLLTLLMVAYFVLINQYTARLQGVLANIHASIPDEINIVIPIKK